MLAKNSDQEALHFMHKFVGIILYKHENHNFILILLAQNRQIFQSLGTPKFYI